MRGALLGAIRLPIEQAPGSAARKRASLRGDRYRLATAQCERGSTPTRAEEVVWQCQSILALRRVQRGDAPRLRARAAEEVW